MHNDFIKKDKTLSLRSTQSPQWANSIKIPLMFTSANLSLTIIKLSYSTLKVSHLMKIRISYQ